MKTKHLLSMTALAAALIAAPVFAGPSAKFAATYSTGPWLTSVADVSGIASAGTEVYVDEQVGQIMATIKVPQDKELLIGLSSEIGLLTDTSIKGKNGGSAKSIAGARAYVDIFAEPVGGGTSVHAKPGQITLSERVQTLSATLGGVIESCEDTLGAFDEVLDENGDPLLDGNGDPVLVEVGDGTIDIATECLVSDEEIGLALDTTAAHHFNFVLPNMDQGEYNIVAYLTTGARAQIVIDDGSNNDGSNVTVSASAVASAIVGSTMLTVQQVRAAKGGVIDATIIE